MDIRLPNLGEDAEGGTVASVFVKVGDTVEKDQALIELESEKAVASIPATSAGTVTAIHVKVGDDIRVGSAIVTLDEEGSAPDSAADSADSTDQAEESEDDDSSHYLEKVLKRPSMQPLPKPGSPPPPPPKLPDGVAPAASPSIRRIARELGIDLGRIHGTARGGRIVMGDLRDHITRLERSAAGRASGEKTPHTDADVDFSQWGPVQTERASTLRRTIAARMTESWTTIPHVTQFADADITALMAMRKKHVAAYEQQGVRLTLTPILLKVIAAALGNHPIINSSWNHAAGEIVTKQYVHLGIAVDTEAGLLVPVIRDVDKKSILEVARELEDLGERARERKLSKEQMQGGTFTVSNQGGIGGAYFTPIINKPEVAILGLGRGREVARVRDGQAEARIMLPLGLSHDHRIIDGANGVRFLVDLIAAIEGFEEAEIEIGG